MPGGAPQILGGPVWWYFVGVYVLALVLGAFSLLDSLRAARRAPLEELPEPWWLYTVAEGAFLALALGVWVPGVPRILSAVPVALVPLALAFDVAYLLRVVFPRPVEESIEAGGEQADPDSPEASQA